MTRTDQIMALADEFALEWFNNPPWLGDSYLMGELAAKQSALRAEVQKLEDELERLTPTEDEKQLARELLQCSPVKASAWVDDATALLRKYVLGEKT